MQLSIITTMYYSAPYLKEFYERIANSAKNITDDYEIIFVNDGSPDNSLEIVLELFESDKKIKIIDLSRNFGHHKAIMTGLSYCSGDYVFLIDCDLEEPTELLGEFWEKINKSKGIDVVYGVQYSRKGGFFEKITGKFFYELFNFLSDVAVPKNLSNVRLMKKKYVDELLKFTEQELFLGGVFIAAGFTQEPFYFKKEGKNCSTYTLSKKMNLFFNSVTSFSNKPLLYVFWLGNFIILCSFLYILYNLGLYYFKGISIQGWTSLIISIWFIGGVIIFCIGLIGLYLSKIFIEVKNRPYSIIKKFYEHT